jgi:hypothetical protein
LLRAGSIPALVTTANAVIKNKEKQVDNYQTIANKLGLLMPFNGNSLTAYWEGDTYRVVSYATLIATYNRETKAEWINPNKYSVTTSKQQNLIRRTWAVA